MALHKNYAARFKVLRDQGGQPTGEVEFYASVFNNVDLIGDRVKEGAFDVSIKAWQASGNPLPIIYSHNWDDAWAIIGYADPKDISVDKIGLKIKCTLDITTNPYAKQIFGLMLRGIVREASFAYDVVKEKKASDGANDLLELSIIECGPTLKGMNPMAGTISAKTFGKEALAGSVEARQQALGYAVSEYVDANNPVAPGDDRWVYIEATFPDSVVAVVSSFDEEPTYLKFDYTIDADGTVTLGAPSEVELTTTLTAKHAETAKSLGTVYVDIVPRLKVGARHSATDMAAIQSMHDALVTLGAECKQDRLQPEDIGDPVDNGKSDGIKAVSSSSGEETHVSEEKAAEVEETKTVTPDPANEKAKDTPAVDDTDAGDDGDEAAPAKKDVPPTDDEGNDGDTEEKAPPAPTDDDDVAKDGAKDAMDGEDDVDADADGDQGKPAEPEEEAEKFDSAQKSTETDEDAARVKAEELAKQAKAEEYAQQSLQAQVELLDLEASLL